MNKSQIVSRAILLVCLLNIAWALKLYFHTSFFPPESYPERHMSAHRAKGILDGMGVTQVGYISEDIFDASGGYDYYDMQNAMAPIVLRRNTEDMVILVHARKSHHIAPVPGFDMVEDLGNDLALFRRR